MAMPLSETYLMTSAAAATLAAAPLGRLVPHQAAPSDVRAFAMLDQVTRPLRHSGRVLLDSDGKMTLYRPGMPPAGQVVPQGAGFTGNLGQGPLAKALGDLSPLRRLLPFARGVAQERVVTFLDGNGKTRCRLTIRVLTGTDGEAAVVSMHRLRGYGKAAKALRDALLDAGGVTLEPERLVQRLFPSEAGCAARPVPALAPDDRAFEAAVALIAAQLDIARQREAGIIADHDSEFLHDYRVALRRIRSVLGLCKGVLSEEQTGLLKQRVSGLMDVTGQLRDLDVYLLDRQSDYDRLPASLHAGLDAKFTLLARARSTARARLVRHLRSPEYAVEMSALSDLFRRRVGLEAGPHADMPALRYARRLIWKRYRRIAGLAATIGTQSTDDDIHALRIECKKLRYLMEFFAPLFDRDQFRTLLRPLKSLQDSLGLVNDCAVQQASLQEFLRGLGKKADNRQLDVAQSIGALTAMLYRQQSEERDRALECLAAFAARDIRRRFQTLFDRPGKDAA